MDAETPTPDLSALLAESGWLRRLSFGLVGNDADADDLTQDTWVEALRGRESVDAPRGWLARIAGRSASRSRRSDRRRRDRESLAVEEDVTIPSPSESIERLELARVLAEALQGVPEPYRRTLYQHYYQDRSAAEIASSESVAPATIRWRLAHGRSLLRTALERRDGRTWNEWALTLAPVAGVPTLESAGLTSLAAVMTIKTTLLGATLGALTAGGVWLVEDPAEAREPGAGRTDVVERTSSPRSDVEVAALAGAGVDESRRATRDEDSADPLFGVVAHGVVRLADGSPAAKASIRLESSPLESHVTRTDATGSWSLLGVAAGQHDLTVESPGSISVRESVDVPDARTWRRDVTLAAAMSIPVRFETRDGEAIRAEPPMRNTYLGLAATAAPPPARLRVGNRSIRWSDSGEFLSREERATPPDLDPRYSGILRLKAAPPLFVSAVYRDVVLETRTLSGGEEELVFVVDDLASRNGSVRVRVVDRTSGAAITEGVHLSHASGGLSVKARIDSSDLVFENVPPGTIELQQRSPAYERLQREVRVLPGEVVDLGTIALGTPAPFEVRTLDEDREPIAARVSAARTELSSNPLDLRLRIGSQPDPNGVTTINWLAPGRTLVRAGGRDGLARVALEVDTRETKEVELVVPAGVEVAFGGVDLEAGEIAVLEDAEGLLLVANDWGMRSETLAPGRYVLRIVAHGVERGRRAFTVGSEDMAVEMGGR